VGLTTLDLIYAVEKVPSANQKIVALETEIASGGPATNAAVTFSHLGNVATLLSVVGQHPMTTLIRSDLAQGGVKLLDLDPSHAASPAISSILVTQTTGERAVVSRNAVKHQAGVEQIPADPLHAVEVVLIDGHQMAVSGAIARQAHGNHIPIVIDGGSWKPGFEDVLPFVDYAICSANFLPPGCSNTTDVFVYLKKVGIRHIAITQGENPIQFSSDGQHGNLAVQSVQVVDTSGAGDILHGAFCHYILQTTFADALGKAAAVATQACQSFGTRQWMADINSPMVE
jgi:sugar/nucleoside kinase (ribokinase family)